MSSPQVHEFLEQFYTEESGQPMPLSERLAQAEAGYVPTSAELTFAGRAAWRNSVRCIGRLFWPALGVRDLRHLSDPDQIFAALVQHLQDAFAGGHIQPLMTVLGDEVRVINSQLIRYAGYPQEGGGVLGDPENVALTRLAQSLGWQGNHTPFDVLPLLLEIRGQVYLYPLPPAAVQEVAISHPDYAAIGELGLRWYAIPAISDAKLQFAGQSLNCVFNGWYMGTEIAARDLTDEHRYNLLPRVAQALGLDTAQERTLWRDRALLELNVAVLHSYRAAGIKIVDHHTAAAQFVRFQEREARAGREVRGKWSWLIAPMSPATSPIWGQSFKGRELEPRFVRREEQGRAAVQCPYSHAGTQ